MVDCYGRKIIAILQMEMTHSVPNYGQIPRDFLEQQFYNYSLINEDFCHTGLRVQLDVFKAHKFAELNQLKYMKDFPPLPSSVWPEGIS